MCGWTSTAGTLLQRRLHKSILTGKGCCITPSACQCSSKEKVLFAQRLPDLVLHVHIIPRPEESEWEDVAGGNAASETPPHLTGTWLPAGVPVPVTPPELFLPLTSPELFLADTPPLPAPFSPLGPPPRTPPEAFSCRWGGA